MQNEILQRAFRLADREVGEALAADPRASLGRHKALVAKQEFLGEVSELAGKWFDRRLATLWEKEKSKRKS